MKPEELLDVLGPLLREIDEKCPQGYTVTRFARSTGRGYLVTTYSRPRRLGEADTLKDAVAKVLEQLDAE